MSNYFIIGTTLLSKDANTTWEVIKQEVFKGGMGGAQCSGQQIDPEIEKFKLGNLDSLLHTSENMQKLEAQMEGFLRKIERQYLDITGETSTNFSIETQDSQGNSIEQFLYKFKWEEKNFSRKKPLGEIVQNINSKMTRLESDFRQKTNTYQEKKNIQANLQQKEGNLYVRDLVDVLNPQIVRDKDFQYSENVTTVVAVVPKAKSKQFLESYAGITDQVLPCSAKLFNYEDKDQLQLYRIFLFTKDLNKKDNDEEEGGKKKLYRGPVEDFIYKMREKLGITVREFHYNKRAFEQRENARRDIQRETQEITTVLTQTCQSHFSALYNAYMHLKYLRLVVDIASRFGQREATVTAVLKPANGKSKQVINNLMKLFCEPSQMAMYGNKEELEDTEDFYPFVYIPINIH